ncbi:hypothetical protein [Streptomyces sp. Ru72]|uniref:hypothetical protein n=1 Tax=Streptomyces sp. Ru72 TaxID=2080747 RepID=UPI000CDDCC5E|nr:hypothetical protein [Streptomyces sp. Ru72]POX54335.1 hypothetical protein C3488_02480 [Streptomyces sp. Ru72]
MQDSEFSAPRTLLLEVFAEKVKSTLAQAGIGISATADPSLSVGAYVEVDDAGEGPLEVFVGWRVHADLYRHFTSLEPAKLRDDERVKVKRHAETVMRQAVASILEFSGFSVLEAKGEHAGQLRVIERP